MATLRIHTVPTFRWSAFDSCSACSTLILPADFHSPSVPTFHKRTRPSLPAEDNIVLQKEQSKERSKLDWRYTYPVTFHSTRLTANLKADRVNTILYIHKNLYSLVLNRGHIDNGPSRVIALKIASTSIGLTVFTNPISILQFFTRLDLPNPHAAVTTSGCDQMIWTPTWGSPR